MQPDRKKQNNAKGLLHIVLTESAAMTLRIGHIIEQQKKHVHRSFQKVHRANTGRLPPRFWADAVRAAGLWQEPGEKNVQPRENGWTSLRLSKKAVLPYIELPQSPLLTR